VTAAFVHDQSRARYVSQKVVLKATSPRTIGEFAEKSKQYADIRALKGGFSLDVGAKVEHNGGDRGVFVALIVVLSFE
jgi:hypothetical protein